MPLRLKNNIIRYIHTRKNTQNMQVDIIIITIVTMMIRVIIIIMTITIIMKMCWWIYRRAFPRIKTGW